jgi:lysophospholipase L1-like esterase
MITLWGFRGTHIAIVTLFLFSTGLSLGATKEHITGTYELSCKEIFSAKRYGKYSSVNLSQLILKSDNTFILDDIAGKFILNPKGHKILLQIEESKLDKLEDRCTEILPELAVEKGIELEPWEVTCSIQKVKISKVKIGKQTTEAKKKLNIKIKGTARFEVDGDLKQKNFYYKRLCKIKNKTAYLDDYYVAFGDSITFGVGDDFDGDGVGYPPILIDLLENAEGVSHTVVNTGIGGEESIDGLARIRGLIDSYPQATHFLVLFGTNDSSGSMPVPSGVRFYGLDPDAPGYGELLEPGDSGYEGSFLDNMQQIIDAIIDDGKIPILAKVPITLGPCSICPPFSNPEVASRNVLIRDYNTVIDALVAANAIGFNPPDFYNYFRTNHDQFSDNLHPDGIGYQSMAILWFNVLSPLEAIGAPP